MNKEAKKITYLICVLVLIRVLVFLGLDFINVKITHYINMIDNKIAVDQLDDDKIHTLLLKDNQEDIFEFHLESSERKAVTLICENTDLAYSIFVNGKARKKFDKNSSELAYSIVDLVEADFNRLEDNKFVAKMRFIRHEKSNIDPVFFIGSQETVRKILALRTIYNTIIYIAFILIIITSIILYKKDRANYLLITFFISAFSLVKSIVLCEFPTISSLLGITLKNYSILISLTSMINYLLYIGLLFNLYDIQIRKNQMNILVFIFMILMGYYCYGNSLNFFMPMYFLGAVIIILFQSIGYMKKKPYNLIILITYSIFDGTILYWFFVSVYKFFDNGVLPSFALPPQWGSIIYVFGLLIAVVKTYFNRIEEYENRQKEFERLNLLRGISHDIKLPLSVIKLNNQMIEKYSLTDAEKKEYAKTSLQATSELEKMIDNINSYLSFKRINTKDEITSIKESFEKLKKYYSIYNQYDDYKYIVECDKKDAYLKINSFQLNRMLFNLIDNAFKYSKKYCFVKISYTINKKVVIIVEDNGIGMDKKQLDKIFDPFYQIDQSRGKGGLGLGLCVVKEIVDSLNGVINVESEKDVGTKIRIILPK